MGIICMSEAISIPLRVLDEIFSLTSTIKTYLYNGNTEHRIKNSAQMNKMNYKLATKNCEDGRNVSKNNQENHSKPVTPHRGPPLVPLDNRFICLFFIFHAIAVYKRAFSRSHFIDAPERCFDINTLLEKTHYEAQVVLAGVLKFLS